MENTPLIDDQSLFKLDFPFATNYQRLVEKPRLALQENVPVWYGVVNATAVGIFAAWRPRSESMASNLEVHSKVPSGKHTKKYGKSPFLMGKSTISIAIFNSKL
jgi:hypothetical protein